MNKKERGRLERKKRIEKGKGRRDGGGRSFPGKGRRHMIIFYVYQSLL